MRVKPYEIAIFILSTLVAIVVGYKMLNIKSPEKEAAPSTQKIVEIGKQELDPALFVQLSSRIHFQR